MPPTWMLDNGADLRFAHEMLGHARVDTTQLYTLVAIGKLIAIHAATHPGATLQRQPKPAADADDTAAGER